MTTEPYTSPKRLRMRPEAKPARTAGSVSSVLVRSMRVSAISAASIAESATKSTSSPIIFTTRPRCSAITSVANARMRARSDARSELASGLDAVEDLEVREALARLLTLADSLQELSLDGVEPAFAPLRWE